MTISHLHLAWCRPVSSVSPMHSVGPALLPQHSLFTLCHFHIFFPPVAFKQSLPLKRTDSTICPESAHFMSSGCPPSFPNPLTAEQLAFCSTMPSTGHWWYSGSFQQQLLLPHQSKKLVVLTQNKCISGKLCKQLKHLFAKKKKSSTEIHKFVETAKQDGQDDP